MTEIIDISSHWHWKSTKICSWSERDEELHYDTIERSIYAIARSLKLLKRCQVDDSPLTIRPDKPV